MTAEEQKQQAGERAALLVEDGMIVGLGSGTTSMAFVRALGKRISSGLRMRAVSSSVLTSRVAHAAGIELIELESRLDLAIDGADAIELGSLRAIKGLGGALTREKLVAVAADQFVLVGDAGKVFSRLADSQPRVPIPVEVLPFGWQLTCSRLGLLGEPVLRMFDEKPFITDNGNLILDLYAADYGQIPDLANAIKEITGVIEHGLFLNMASRAIVAGHDGVEELVVGAG
ncbi:ribose-5-phosphate isomerase RpiA [soil metagenome]